MRSLLVVEDDIAQATDIADSLELAGYQVLGPVRTVREAMHAVQVDQPDAALLDLQLGSDDSIQVATRLMRRGIPILFVSGHPKPLHVHAAYLAKPYSDRDLLRSVADLFKRTGG